MIIVFASLLKRGSTLKGKMGSKFFPFRVDFFSEGIWCTGEQMGIHKSCLPCIKWW